MNHPGLVCCVQQTTGIPLVIMVKPDTFLIQEIKTLPAKAKVCPRSQHGSKCVFDDLFVMILKAYSVLHRSRTWWPFVTQPVTSSSVLPWSCCVRTAASAYTWPMSRTHPTGSSHLCSPVVSSVSWSLSGNAKLLQLVSSRHSTAYRSLKYF